jgi:hypothetical protein
MNCFSKNGCLHANGVELVVGTPCWPFDLMATIHDAPCHWSRRTEWALPSRSTAHVEPSSVSASRNASTGAIDS